MVKNGPQEFSQHPCGSFYYCMEAGSPSQMPIPDTQFGIHHETGVQKLRKLSNII
jgi:hypothetical protein